MLTLSIGNLTLQIYQGDLTKAKVNAVVNAANEQMIPGGGVDGAINQAAGPQLAPLQRSLGPLAPGQAVITPGFALPADHIIHTVGPIYVDGHHQEAAILAACYQHCLQLADQHHLISVAFPAISTGVYRFPVAATLPIIDHVLHQFAQKAQTVREVHLINYESDIQRRYERYFQNQQ